MIHIVETTTISNYEITPNWSGPRELIDRLTRTSQRGLAFVEGILPGTYDHMCCVQLSYINGNKGKCWLYYPKEYDQKEDYDGLRPSQLKAGMLVDHLSIPTREGMGMPHERLLAVDPVALERKWFGYE